MAIDPVLFDDVKALDPAETTGRTGADWDADAGEYRIRIWDEEYRVDAAQKRILPERWGGGLLKEYMDLFVVHYLMKARAPSLTGKWVSEKDIPGGSAFFRGPHTLPTADIADAFGENLDGFAAVCEGLGGRPLDMADAAYVFEITPAVPMAILLWEGDEDFGAESRLLFDRSIDRHLPLDIIYAIAVLVCKVVCLPRD